MDDKVRRRIQLDCLYDMFRGRVEENVVYLVYSENEAKIDTTIDQLMSIAACSFTGHSFQQSFKPITDRNITINAKSMPQPLVSRQNDSVNSDKRSLTPKPINVSCSSNRASRSRSVDSKCPEKVLTCSKCESDDLIDDTHLDIDERIKRLQKSIENLLIEKNTCHEKATHYLSKKMFPVTSYYSELASQLRGMIDDRTKQLVDLLLVKSKNSNQIDLHGLNPIQARLVVSELLKIRQDKLLIDKQGEASVDIITGWGKHCVTNGQRIRPTIVALLREKGLEYYHLNKGALRVTIRR